MKILSLELPEPLATALAAAADRRGTTKSALLRDALASYLSLQERAPAPPSFLDLAADLAGSVAGPADLSTNPEHLCELGR